MTDLWEMRLMDQVIAERDALRDENTRLRERCAKLERVAEAARTFRDLPDDNCVEEYWDDLVDALAALGEG